MLLFTRLCCLPSGWELPVLVDCQESNDTLLFLLQRAYPNTVLPLFQLAPSRQTLGSNSQSAPFQTLRLLRGPDWPGNPLTLLQLKATWWPEPVGFISFALQMLTSHVWAWKKKTLKFLLISVSKGLWLTKSGDFLQNLSLLCGWLNSTWFRTRHTV